MEKRIEEIEKALGIYELNVTKCKDESSENDQGNSMTIIERIDEMEILLTKSNGNEAINDNNKRNLLSDLYYQVREIQELEQKLMSSYSSPKLALPFKHEATLESFSITSLKHDEILTSFDFMKDGLDKLSTIQDLLKSHKNTGELPHCPIIESNAYSFSSKEQNVKRLKDLNNRVNKVSLKVNEVTSKIDETLERYYSLMVECSDKMIFLNDLLTDLEVKNNKTA